MLITAADMSGTPGEGLIVLQDQRRAHQQILQRVAVVTHYSHQKKKPLHCLKGGKDLTSYNEQLVNGVQWGGFT